MLCNIRLLDADLKLSSSQADELQSLANKAKHAVRNSIPTVESSSDWRLEELEDLDLTVTSDRFSLGTTLAAPSSRSLTLLGNQSLMSLSSTRLQNAPVKGHDANTSINERERVHKAMDTLSLPPLGGLSSNETFKPRVKISRLGLSEVYRPPSGTDIVAQSVTLFPFAYSEADRIQGSSSSMA